MKITKFGQCCLLIETKNKRILTDPGRFSTAQDSLTNIDLVLITHEHADHFHTESVQEIVKNNPKVEVVTNKSVGKLLAELGVSYTELEGRATEILAEITIEAYEGQHVEIYGDYGLVQNTGYLIDNELFYPGDAYTVPENSPNILALPVAGPWCKVSEAIDYALEVKPETAFPVHDALLSEVGKISHYAHFGRVLPENNISFVELRENETKEF